ncbi:MAG TPA: hypothetical protein VER32_16160 [Pyrinomonadaceae bacterium]|nr:hypothetical protein [Pyrinomonadaceae bacterium]
MSCKKYTAEIEDAAAGSALSGGARLHLDACPACREFRRERESLRALVGSLGTIPAPADFEFRLRARMRADSAAPRRSLFGLAYAPAAGVALAAVFAVAVTLTLYTRQGADDAPAARVESARVESQQAGASPAQATRESERDGRAGVEEFEKVADKAKGGRGASGVAPRRASRDSSLASVVKARGTGHRTAVFNESRAMVITKPAQGEVALTGLTVAVPLPNSERPLKVLVSDERGASRVVPVRMVSFGSQELVARAGHQRAGANDKEVVW